MFSKLLKESISYKIWFSMYFSTPSSLQVNKPYLDLKFWKCVLNSVGIQLLLCIADNRYTYMKSI